VFLQGKRKFESVQIRFPEKILRTGLEGDLSRESSNPTGAIGVSRFPGIVHL
jgi:hypothetical protein